LAGDRRDPSVRAAASDALSRHITYANAAKHPDAT
jgi:hypothetical protein